MHYGTAKEIKLPRLGMGTWCFGGRTEHDPGNDDAGQIEALQKGIELGFRLIDTAEYYASGYAETLIGKAIAGFDRKELFITSKVWKTNVSRDGVLRAAEGSLKRLGIDCLDCFLYHQFNPAVPLEETMGALNDPDVHHRHLSGDRVCGLSVRFHYVVLPWLFLDDCLPSIA